MAVSHTGRSSYPAGGLSRRAFLALGASATLAAGLFAGGCAGTSASEGDGASNDEGHVKGEVPEGSGADAGTAVSDAPTLIEPGKLIVGSDCEYPPFTMLEDGRAAGFEYDLMCAICEEIDLECEYHTPLKFDTLCAAVAAGGTVDVAVSAITIDPDRAETVDFTDPYFDSNQSVTVLKDSGFKTVGDLAGEAIAVQSGTTGETWAKENIADAEVTAFDEAPAALAALQAGKASAVVIDLPVAIELLEGAYDTCEIIEEVPTGEQYAIAVSKDNPALLELLNEGLASVRESGRYQEIYDDYFGLIG